MGFAIFVFVFVFVITIWALIAKATAQQKAMAAMTPEELNAFQFGPVNDKLICPHCQTGGTVRAKVATRTDVSTGKVGGILKTDTKSATVRTVTQHHCDHCGTTWDI